MSTITIVSYTFPVELFINILCYTDPRDIIRWRTVSKWFHAITVNPALWKAVYADAPFIRPPGPFPSQSTTYLERALVQSMRLAQSWTNRPLQIVSHIEIPVPEKYDPHSAEQPELIDGRWFILRPSSERFALYDTDSNDVQPERTLWVSNGRISCVPSMCVGKGEEGQWLVHVLFNDTDNGSLSLKLLEFSLDGESGSLHSTNIFLVPGEPNPGPIFCARGLSPFIYLRRQDLVFNTHTRTFYRFPEFYFALAKTRAQFFVGEPTVSSIEDAYDVIVTKTHVIAFHSYISSLGNLCIVLIQAFNVPTASSSKDGLENQTATLSLSHEGTFLGCGRIPDVLLRDSIVDPTTGSINLRFLYRWINDPKPNCLDLTLENAPGTEVLPIGIRILEITREDGGQILPFPGTIQIEFNLSHAFGDGHMRGICWESSPGSCGQRHATYGCCDECRKIAKFTIDGTQDRCVAVVGEFVTPPVEVIDPWMIHRNIGFEGTRGKFIRSHGCEIGLKDNIVDIFTVE